MPALPICFFDLDKTLYNTDLLVADIEKYLRTVGHDNATIRHTLNLAIEQGYSFDRHLRLLGHSEERIRIHARILGDLLDRGDRYLLPGVSAGLQTLSATIDCALLTFGDPRFQGQKRRGIKAFHGIFSSEHYVWKRHTKGDVIRDRGRGIAWILEDTPTHLEDVRRKAPWVRRVRMRSIDINTKPHPGDGEKWSVVTSFSEFVDLVLNVN